MGVLAAGVKSQNRHSGEWRALENLARIGAAFSQDLRSRPDSVFKERTALVQRADDSIVAIRLTRGTE